MIGVASGLDERGEEVGISGEPIIVVGNPEGAAGGVGEKGMPDDGLGDDVVIHPGDDEMRGVFPEQFEPAFEIDVSRFPLVVEMALSDQLEKKMKPLRGLELFGENLASVFPGRFGLLDCGGDFGEGTVSGFLGGEGSTREHFGQVVDEDGAEGFLSESLHPVRDPLQSLLELRGLREIPFCPGEGVLELIGEATLAELIDKREESGRTGAEAWGVAGRVLAIRVRLGFLFIFRQGADEGLGEVGTTQESGNGLERAGREECCGLVEEVVDPVVRDRLSGGVVGRPAPLRRGLLEGSDRFRIGDSNCGNDGRILEIPESLLEKFAGQFGLVGGGRRVADDFLGIGDLNFGLEPMLRERRSPFAKTMGFALGGMDHDLDWDVVGSSLEGLDGERIEVGSSSDENGFYLVGKGSGLDSIESRECLIAQPEFLRPADRK